MTTQHETDERRRLERAPEIALFRYSLIQDVISSQLTAAQRGRRVRQLAAMTHPGPGGTEVRVSYQTISRWKRITWRAGSRRWSRRRGRPVPARRARCWRWRPR